MANQLHEAGSDPEAVSAWLGAAINGDSSNAIEGIDALALSDLYLPDANGNRRIRYPGPDELDSTSTDEDAQLLRYAATEGGLPYLVHLINGGGSKSNGFVDGLEADAVEDDVANHEIWPNILEKVSEEREPGSILARAIACLRILGSDVGVEPEETVQLLACLRKRAQHHLNTLLIEHPALLWSRLLIKSSPSIDRMVELLPMMNVIEASAYAELPRARHWTPTRPAPKESAGCPDTAGRLAEFAKNPCVLDALHAKTTGHVTAISQSTTRVSGQYANGFMSSVVELYGLLGRDRPGAPDPYWDHACRNGISYLEAHKERVIIGALEAAGLHLRQVGYAGLNRGLPPESSGYLQAIRESRVGSEPWFIEEFDLRRGALFARFIGANRVDGLMATRAAATIELLVETGAIGDRASAARTLFAMALGAGVTREPGAPPVAQLPPASFDAAVDFINLMGSQGIGVAEVAAAARHAIDRLSELEDDDTLPEFADVWLHAIDTCEAEDAMRGAVKAASVSSGAVPSSRRRSTIL